MYKNRILYCNILFVIYQLLYVKIENKYLSIYLIIDGEDGDVKHLVIQVIPYAIGGSEHELSVPADWSESSMGGM